MQELSHNTKGESETDHGCAAMRWCDLHQFFLLGLYICELSC